ncbi:sulfatase modifying factor 1 precursor [Candidatus Magnetomorum sp. HK-1]|nr:sulfatase modifying factor 1 precursor [Candidatus Magnetomorum sp. HK-1]
MKYILSLFTLIIYSSAYTTIYHPADTNKDWQISKTEFEAYDTAWKYSKDWPEPPNPIPGLYVARAGYLYKKGNCYKGVREGVKKGSSLLLTLLGA